VWFSDTSEEAARKRREEMIPESILVEKLKIDDNNNEDLIKSLKEAIKSGVEAIQQLQSSKKDLDESAFSTALFSALFASDADLLAEIKSRTSILSKVITSKSSQLSLLSNIETFLGQSKNQISKIPLVLKELYDKEILDEENILYWAEKVKGIKAVRDSAAPMIKWLKEAEEESDEEEEDGEEGKRRRMKMIIN